MMVLRHYLWALVMPSADPFREPVAPQRDLRKRFRHGVARYQNPHGLGPVVSTSPHFDLVVDGDPQLYHSRLLTKLNMVDEENIGDDDDVKGCVPILLETLPMIVAAYQNGFPRFRALVAVMAYMEPPSSVRFHYSLVLGHHVRWDF